MFSSISSAVFLACAVAYSQTPPTEAPKVPGSESVLGEASGTPAPVKRPATPESLPLVPGGGKVVPPSVPLTPGGKDAKPKNPSDVSTYPLRYRALLGQSMSSFHARDFKGALATLQKADEILPATPWSLNIRGAVAIEQRNWDEGIRSCVEALRIDPGFYPAKFNLCEIPFYQGKYAEARTLWEKLLIQQPNDELLMYRIFLTYLLQGDTVNTDAWLKKLPFPSETPAYQYAHAAFYYRMEDLARKNNNKEESAKAAAKAAEWKKTAEFVWPEQKRANFVDVLMQIGWIKREELPTEQP